MKRIGAYEAKKNLARLLDEVAAGETITITRHGRAVAVLAPASPVPSSVLEAARGLRTFRAQHRLAGVRIRDLIDEGRKRRSSSTRLWRWPGALGDEHDDLAERALHRVVTDGSAAPARQVCTR